MLRIDAPEQDPQRRQGNNNILKEDANMKETGNCGVEMNSETINGDRVELSIDRTENKEGDAWMKPKVYRKKKTMQNEESLS